jgi:hypothetical protein
LTSLVGVITNKIAQQSIAVGDNTNSGGSGGFLQPTSTIFNHLQQPSKFSLKDLFLFWVFITNFISWIGFHS